MCVVATIIYSSTNAKRYFLTKKEFNKLLGSEKTQYLIEKFEAICQYGVNDFADYEKVAFYYMDDKTGKWITCDNRDCCCWVDEFDTAKEAVEWLHDEELETR